MQCIARRRSRTATTIRIRWFRNFLHPTSAIRILRLEADRYTIKITSSFQLDPGKMVTIRRPTFLRAAEAKPEPFYLFVYSILNKSCLQFLKRNQAATSSKIVSQPPPWDEVYLCTIRLQDQQGHLKGISSGESSSKRDLLHTAGHPHPFEFFCTIMFK